jgi:hypothetical protein
MMTRTRRISLVAALAVFLVAPSVNAEAVPLSDRHIQVIKTNCLIAQSSMQQLQRTEAATRVNRGRAYESISKLLVALNSRVTVNKLTAPTLAVATTEMDKRFTAFKTDYSAYEDSMVATIKLSCRDQPVTFYDSLTRTRELRVRVAADIKSLNEALDAYQSGVNELRASVTQAEGVSQ